MNNRGRNKTGNCQVLTLWGYSSVVECMLCICDVLGFNLWHQNLKLKFKIPHLSCPNLIPNSHLPLSSLSHFTIEDFPTKINHFWSQRVFFFMYRSMNGSGQLIRHKSISSYTEHISCYCQLWCSILPQCVFINLIVLRHWHVYCSPFHPLCWSLAAHGVLSIYHNFSCLVFKRSHLLSQWDPAACAWAGSPKSTSKHSLWLTWILLGFSLS